MSSPRVKPRVRVPMLCDACHTEIPEIGGYRYVADRAGLNGRRFHYGCAVPKEGKATP